MNTSLHYQTLFRLRFQLNIYEEDHQLSPLSEVVCLSSPITIVSHTNYLQKPKQSTTDDGT